MNAHTEKTSKNEHQAVADNSPKQQNNSEFTFQFVDNRPEGIAQQKFQEAVNNSPRVQQLEPYQEMANNSPQVKQLSAYQVMADQYTSPTIQRKKNKEERASADTSESVQRKANTTGLPDQLKSGIEQLSGHSMNDVNVHYNSDKPAQLHAHAYAQGTDIHVAPGQEKHVPHEAWHVVQQKQGRVKPTMQLKGKVNVNDDAGLEKEADIMGRKASDLKSSTTLNGASAFVQRKEKDEVLSSSLITQRAPITVEPPKSLLLPCGHESTCVLQRMITVEPPDTKDLEALEKYVFGTSINARNQTFEHAVKGNARAQMLFEGLEISLNKGEVDAALLKIKQIIELINVNEAKEPDHPNQVWRGAEAKKNAKLHEAPYSISKTSASIAMANEARKIILSTNLLKEDKFMLGVLVLPNGKAIVALSGSRADLLEPLADLLRKPIPLFGDQVYDIRSISHSDRINYEKTAMQETATLTDFGEEHGKIVRLRAEDKEDLGSYPATCAAAVALSVAKSVSPKSFVSEGKMGLTEVFVSTNKRSQVMIYNKHTTEGEKFSMEHTDVPSCHVCQMQLGHVASDVVKLERKGILVRLEMRMDEKKQEMILMQKELESLLIGQKKTDMIASAKDGLQALLDEGKKWEEKLNMQLKEVQKSLKQCTVQLEKMISGMRSLENRIGELATSNKDLNWQIEQKGEVARNVRQLEKDLNALELKVVSLTKDETELSEAASKWNAPFYTDWKKKVEELLARKEYAKSDKDTITKTLSDHLAAEKGNLANEKLRAQNRASAAEHTAKADELKLTRKKINIEWTAKKDELQPLKPEAEKLTIQHQELSSKQHQLEAELKTAIARNTDLTSRLEESSDAGKALRETKHLVKKLERDIMKAERELIRLDMTRSVYQ